jgi:hypothetical protein
MTGSAHERNRPGSEKVGLAHAGDGRNVSVVVDQCDQCPAAPSRNDAFDVEHAAAEATVERLPATLNLLPLPVLRHR